MDARPQTEWITAIIRPSYGGVALVSVGPR